jgi:hypothetical protein
MQLVSRGQRIKVAGFQGTSENFPLNIISRNKIALQKQLKQRKK